MIVLHKVGAIKNLKQFSAGNQLKKAFNMSSLYAFSYYILFIPVFPIKHHSRANFY